MTLCWAQYIVIDGTHTAVYLFIISIVWLNTAIPDDACIHNSAKNVLLQLIIEETITI